MKLFKLWALSLCLLVVTVVTVGVVVANDNKEIQHQEVTEISEASESVQVSVETPTPSASLSVEESLKICKDESGNIKACDDADVFKHLLVSMGGIKGASALMIAFIISKFLLLLLLSPFFTNIFPSLLKGGVKLTVASGLNVVVGVLSLMVPPVELSFGAALMHSSVLALASVFANQAYKQYLTKKGQS